jgi:hypothetical protein
MKLLQSSGSVELEVADPTHLLLLPFLQFRSVDPVRVIAGMGSWDKIFLSWLLSKEI